MSVRLAKMTEVLITQNDDKTTAKDTHVRWVNIEKITDLQAHPLVDDVTWVRLGVDILWAMRGSVKNIMDAISGAEEY